MNYIFQYLFYFAFSLRDFNYADAGSAWSMYLIIFSSFLFYLIKCYYSYLPCFLLSFLHCLAFPVFLSNFVFISWIVLVLFSWTYQLTLHLIRWPVIFLSFDVVFYFCGLPPKSYYFFLIIIYGEIFYHTFHLPWGLIFLVTLFMNKGYYTFFFLSLMLCVFFLYYSSLREVDFLN